MASDGNAFEILPDPHLENLTTPAVTTFLETHNYYDRIIDGENPPLPPSTRSSMTPLKTAIAPRVLTVICRHHVRVSEDDLTDEALLAFLQGYAKTSLQGDDYDLTYLGAEIEYQMNLKPFYRVENLACQCEKMIQTMATADP
jgi:hypothetical protein